MKRIAVMLSGRGSNFAALLRAIDKGTVPGQVVLVVSNRSDAGGLDLAKERGIPSKVIQKRDFENPEDFDRANLRVLQEASVDMVVLAGYLSLIGPHTVAAFPEAIVNVHPALLPSFGGPGYYGHHVHEAVLKAGCKLSGATVHFVTDGVDEGPIIAQGAVPVLDEDSAESLAARVLAQEHRLLPAAVGATLRGELSIKEGRVFGFASDGLAENDM